MYDFFSLQVLLPLSNPEEVFCTLESQADRLLSLSTGDSFGKDEDALLQVSASLSLCATCLRRLELEEEALPGISEVARKVLKAVDSLKTREEVVENFLFDRYIRRWKVKKRYSKIRIIYPSLSM